MGDEFCDLDVQRPDNLRHHGSPRSCKVGLVKHTPGRRQVVTAISSTSAGAAQLNQLC
jgi:hypothetical protein